MGVIVPLRDRPHLLNYLASGGGKVRAGSLLGTLTDQGGQYGHATSAGAAVLKGVEHITHKRSENREGKWETPTTTTCCTDRHKITS
jgi:hypothetical protein